MAENEINKVCVLIRRFLYEVDGILEDKDACQKWLVSFAKTLQFQDLCKDPNEYAILLLNEARDFNCVQKRKSQMKIVRKALAEDGVKNPSKEQLEQRWLEIFGSEDSGTGAKDSCKGKKSAQAGSHNTGTALVPASEPLWGEFQNVEISQDQFNELAQYVGNVEECKKLINSFSANIADGTVTSKNHFATLKKWADARKRFGEKNEKAEANNTMSFQEIEGQRQVAQLRKYGLIK